MIPEVDLSCWRSFQLKSITIPVSTSFFVVLQVEKEKNRSPIWRFWPLLDISDDERKVKEQSPHLESAKGKYRGGEEVYRANHDPLFMYLLFLG